MTVAGEPVAPPLDEAAALAGVERLVILLVQRALERRPFLTPHRDDLLQEALLIALGAIRRFDPHRRTKLSSFVATSVELGLRRVIPDVGAVIRPPRNLGLLPLTVLSLDAPVPGLEEGLAETLPGSDGREEQDRRDEEEDTRTTVDAALVSLDRRSADVLRRRFGLSAPRETLEEIGARHRVSRERVRQIEVAALKHLRSGESRRGRRRGRPARA